MCGIVGYMGDPHHAHKRVFADLLQMDVIRGGDSTGMFTVTKKGDVSWYKSLALPTDYLQVKTVTKMLNQPNFLVVGHNRAATRGAITSKNAHPFTCGAVTGVHNGTLKNKYDLPDARDYEVDSENLYHAIDKVGLKNAIAMTEGAYALVWVDEVDDSLNFLRNSERPLSFAMEKNNKCMWFASELGMLKYAMARHGVELGTHGSFKEDIHYKFPRGLVQNVIPPPELATIEGKPKPLTHGSCRGAGAGVKGNQREQGKDKKNGNKKVHVHRSTVSRNGVKYSVGDNITFIVKEHEELQSSRKYIGYDSENTTQKVVVFVDKKHLIYDALTDYGIEWKGEIANIVWQQQADKTNDEPVLFLKTSTVEEVPLPPVKPNGKAAVKDIHDGPRNKDGQRVSVAKWRELTKDGCSTCGDPVDVKDHDKILWLMHGNSANEYVCPNCLKEDWVMEYLHETNEIRGDN